MFLGVDIGSSSSKAALINDKKELVADAVVNKGTGTDGIDLALKQVYEKAGITMTILNIRWLLVMAASPTRRQTSRLPRSLVMPRGLHSW